MSVPNWWEAMLLLLAAYRTFRIIGIDTILDRPREKFVRKAKAELGEYRQELDIFIHCPWCLGWWMMLAWWIAWQVWPHGSLVAATPLALSAVVGLVGKNLDA